MVDRMDLFVEGSEITLQWIRSPPNTWKTYVANRVSEIQNFTQGCVWNHVAGCENPADLVSRGMAVADFIESKLWCSGLDWLSNPEQNWPTSTPRNVPEASIEVRTTSAAVTATPATNPLFLRWSSYTRLLHVVAYCQRFTENCRAKARTQPNATRPIIVSLYPHQLSNAKATLTRLAQNDSFPSKAEQNKTQLYHPLIFTSSFVLNRLYLRNEFASYHKNNKTSYNLL